MTVVILFERNKSVKGKFKGKLYKIISKSELSKLALFSEDINILPKTYLGEAFEYSKIIPEGIYEIERRFTKKYKFHLRINNVKNFPLALIKESNGINGTKSIFIPSNYYMDILISIYEFLNRGVKVYLKIVKI